MKSPDRDHNLARPSSEQLTMWFDVTCTSVTAPSCPSRVLRHWPVVTSHNRIVRSAFPETSTPSLRTWSVPVNESCPRNMFIHCQARDCEIIADSRRWPLSEHTSPVAMCQTRIVVSSDPDAIHSSVIRIEYILSSCPTKT